MQVEDRSIINEKNSLLALVQINDMSLEQKEYFSALMTRMVIVDGDINVNEVAIYDIVCKFCDLQKDFGKQELPEGLTYS